MDQVPICSYSTENNRKIYLNISLGFFNYLLSSRASVAKILKITWDKIPPIWVCKLSLNLYFQPKLWGFQRQWKFHILYLNQTLSTCTSKACQKESPSGVPHGLEFHALKELSVGVAKSNLLLKSMFVIPLFLLLILKLFDFLPSNSRL